MYTYIYLTYTKVKGHDVTYDQVWWPILGICGLHLNHPKCTHTAVNTHTPWTHTQSSGQLFMLRHPGSSWGFSALLKGTSVVVLRVERALYIHSPHLQFLLDLRLEPATLGLRVRLKPLGHDFPYILTSILKSWSIFARHLDLRKATN